jgi:DNA mismatch endonuclease (patch repair protein)
MERLLKATLKNGRFSNVTPERSRIMASVRDKRNKTTELALRMGFVRAKVTGWVLHPKHIDGTPDFYFPRQRLATFSDGCFWHGCPRCGHIPKTNDAYWKSKIGRNRERDQQTSRMLRSKGIRTVRVWEHSLRGAPRVQSVVVKILRLLNV